MRIKFLLATLAVSAFMCMPIQAQDELETRHEVAVSYGAVPNSVWIDIYTDIIPAIFGEERKGKGYFGPIGLEYYYHTSSLIGVGAVAVYASSKQDCFYKDFSHHQVLLQFYAVDKVQLAAQNELGPVFQGGSWCLLRSLQR